MESLQVCAFQRGHEARSIAPFKHGDKVPKEHHCPTPPAGAGRAGAEGPKAGASPAALRRLEEKPPQKQDQEVSVPTRRPGDRRRSVRCIVLVTGERGRWSPSALAFIASFSSQQERQNPFLLCSRTGSTSPQLWVLHSFTKPLADRLLTEETAPRQLHLR